MDRKFLNLPRVFAELAEKSDQIIRDNARPPPQVKEWFKIIIETAQKIADGEFAKGKSSSTSGSSKEFLEFSPSSVPSCLQLVKGEAETLSTRVSAFFPLQERDHLHRKKSANASGKKTNSENGARSSIHVNGKKVNLLKVENGSRSNYSDENSRATPRKASTRGKKSSAKAESDEANSTGAVNSSTSSRRASTRGKKNSAKFENGLDNNTNSGKFFMTPKNASARGKENTPKVETNSDVYIVAENVQLATPIDSGLDRTFVKQDFDGKFATPVRKSKGTPLNLKSKRKSSRNLSKMSSLEQEMFQKKLKGLSSHSNKPNLVTRSSRFSMGKKKFSGLKETHQPSALAARCSSKASGTGKKETLQYKENIAAENLKKLQDARQKKIEEKKRLRDEKMERTKEKRMNLEKAKTHCAKPKTTEPITRSTRAQDRSAERITRSKEPRGESTSDAIQILKVKVSQANSQQKTARSERKKSTPPLKTPLKSSQTNSKQKAAQSEIKSPIQSPPKRTQASSKARTPTPPLKTPLPNGTPPSSRGRRPTPPMKTQPLKVTPNPTVISLHNTTVSLNKETGSNGILKRTITPTSPPSSKAISKLKESISTSGQKMAESSSPSNSKKPKLEVPASAPKTPAAAKKPDSYEMTPDRSSFTSYDMSEIVSDDDDDEETSGTTKPVPSWALGLRLRNALIHQYYNPVDTDDLFGNTCEVPDLEQMFDVKKKAYSKRTSSAIWQSPRTFR